MDVIDFFGKNKMFFRRIILSLVLCSIFTGTTQAAFVHPGILHTRAAYQCAVMWCITGDIAYANKSKEIINAWSSTLKSITGRDAVLMAGLDVPLSPGGGQAVWITPEELKIL